jgi:hypothetical protein
VVVALSQIGLLTERVRDGLAKLDLLDFAGGRRLAADAAAGARR